MEPILNYKEFRKKKIKKYGILEVIWGTDLTFEVLYHCEDYSLRYIKSGRRYEIASNLIMWQYFLAELRFKEC